MDVHIEQLRVLFLTHPAWLRAAESIREGSASRVTFSHVRGEYHLLRKDGQSLLSEGPAEDPDFGFRFTPKSIERLAAVQGHEIADFAVELFDCIVSDDPEVQVGLRVLGGFTKLFWRGYVTLLFKSGPRVAAYLSGRGIHNVSDLRKFLKQARASDPRWENL